jgi:hypothetical protein
MQRGSVIRYYIIRFHFSAISDLFTEGFKMFLGEKRIKIKNMATSGK